MAEFGCNDGVDEGNPETWLCPEPLKIACLGLRSDLDPDATWALFRDYWLGVAGRDGVKIDWPATWRKWVRKEKAPGGARGTAAIEARNAAVKYTPPAEDLLSEGPP